MVPKRLVSVDYCHPDANPPRIVVLDRFHTVAEAEAWIAKREQIDPEGVHDGYYGINAPEIMINPPYRREEVQP